MLCDVLPMQSCHMLFGRPWLTDRDVRYQVESNKYSFVLGGQKHTLVPLTPYQVSEDYKIMRELREVLKREQLEKEKKELVQERELYEIDEPRSDLEEVHKEHLIVGLANTNPLLPINYGASILPSTIPSLLQVHGQLFLNEDPNKVPHEQRVEGLIMELPSKSTLKQK